PDLEKTSLRISALTPPVFFDAEGHIPHLGRRDISSAGSRTVAHLHERNAVILWNGAARILPRHLPRGALGPRRRHTRLRRRSLRADLSRGVDKHALAG